MSVRFEVLPPLSLYIHLPWCVKKCPYCDFNSHALRDEIPETAYVNALLMDLDSQLHYITNRPFQSIFIGGGTPSLFSPQAIGNLLRGIRERVECTPNIEVTLEANPGTVNKKCFAGFRNAGVNRLSIGVQSFDDTKLASLGRIHDASEALQSAQIACASGFDNFNLDLMYGLPHQSPEQALSDLRQAIELEPTHLSTYQLTIEQNTLFHRQPPLLPDDETLWNVHQYLADKLSDSGFEQYEVSAYARLSKRCRHNENYWQFGDYIGIGAGAHGKITTHHQVVRTIKQKHPTRYLQNSVKPLSTRIVERDEIAFEFLMNALRLREGFEPALFEQRTGEGISVIEPVVENAIQQSLLENSGSHIRATDLGFRFLNDLLELFLPLPRKGASSIALVR